MISHAEWMTVIAMHHQPVMRWNGIPSGYATSAELSHADSLASGSRQRPMSHWHMTPLMYANDSIRSPQGLSASEPFHHLGMQ